MRLGKLISIFIKVELIYLLIAIYILTNVIEDSFIQKMSVLYSQASAGGLGM